MPVALPPVPEQRKIAKSFECIDESVQSTERLIAKLENSRLGLVSDVLDSRCEEYELGDFIAFGPQNGLYKPEAAYVNHGVGIVRIDSFDSGVIHSLRSLKRVAANPGEVKLYRLRSGDILINRVNTPELVGKCALVPELEKSALFESNVMRLRVRDDVLIP